VINGGSFPFKRIWTALLFNMLWFTCLWRDRAGIQGWDRLLKPFPAGSGEFIEETKEMPQGISFVQLVSPQNSAISPEPSKKYLK
jgi:hypothetical protein